MKREGFLWVAAAALLAAVLGVVVLAIDDLGTVLIAIVGLLGVLALAGRMAAERDRSWLPQTFVAAYLVKMVGAAVRWWVLVDVYNGVGDAGGYHNAGRQLAAVWRSLEVPALQGFGTEGTQFVRVVAGLLYAPYTPNSMLGGFFLFATVAFTGQMLFYAAFRRAFPDGRLGWYAAGIFFVPSMVFWPSSIGKESLMVFFLGVLAYGTARLFTEFRLRWVVVVLGGLVGAAAVRAHIAALGAGALAGAMLLARSPAVKGASFRRLLLVGLAIAGAVLFVSAASETLGVDLSGDNLDPFLSDLERNTRQGGSAVEGEAVRGIGDIPAASVRVLFRPFPTEAQNLQTFLSSLESLVLLVVLVWRLPKIVRDLRKLRRCAYALFSFAFTIGFVVVFSGIFNLGILARQRVQALPFLLVVVVGLGFSPGEASEPTETSVPPAKSAYPGRLL